MAHKNLWGKDPWVYWFSSGGETSASPHQYQHEQNLPPPPPLYRAQLGMTLPGKGMLAKLLVNTCRRVSRCCCKTVLRLRSWITSTSSFSTAVRMLSTCFCRAAFLSSNSMLDFRSWRSSASRAEDKTQVIPASLRSPDDSYRKSCLAVSN